MGSEMMSVKIREIERIEELVGDTALGAVGARGLGEEARLEELTHTLEEDVGNHGHNNEHDHAHNSGKHTRRNLIVAHGALDARLLRLCSDTSHEPSPPSHQ